MNPSPALSAVLAFLWLMAAPVVQAGEIRTQVVQFAKGHSSATLKGTIKGSQTIDYTLRAKAGQTMNVTLKTGNGANYFNVLPPGSDDVAIFVGSIGGNEWSGALPADGEYKVRVYLMRGAARRNETAGYTLTVGITGAPKASELGRAPASDAKVQGTPYHATGLLSCSLGKDKPMQCEFGVIRGKSGNGEVHITPPGGPKRVLTFMGDKVTTNPGERVKSVKQRDGWSVEVNDRERYTIPEAVISGG